MQPLRARVHNGRIRLDEPSDLPEGTELDLLPVNLSDEFDDAERSEIIESIEAGAADIENGEFVDGLAFANELISKRESQTR